MAFHTIQQNTAPARSAPTVVIKPAATLDAEPTLGRLAVD
jgi:hypothetical protein